MSDYIRGVFWLIEGDILAVPFDGNIDFGLAKSGNNYNHKLLWERVKPRKWESQLPL